MALAAWLARTRHKSEDFTRVVNTVQWRSKADSAAMQQNLEVGQHMKAAGELAKGFKPVMSEVVWAE